MKNFLSIIPKKLPKPQVQVENYSKDAPSAIKPVFLAA
jgi:hypothetical protein